VQLVQNPLDRIQLQWLAHKTGRAIAGQADGADCRIQNVFFFTIATKGPRAAMGAIWSEPPSARSALDGYFFPKTENCSGLDIAASCQRVLLAKTYGLWQQHCSILLSRKEGEVQP
jgi:hypothetical protein